VNDYAATCAELGAAEDIAIDCIDLIERATEDRDVSTLAIVAVILAREYALPNSAQRLLLPDFDWRRVFFEYLSTAVGIVQREAGSTGRNEGGSA
jgi:hypothetical protein